ncbi:Calponin-3 [Gonapodya sp. JEL0774]|nr:Calponin-3 [Gonapodya sp. JEL0774]
MVAHLLPFLEPTKLPTSVVNACFPGAIPKIQQSKMPFKQMENVQSFLQACETIAGMKKHDLFQTVDLYENKNIVQVIDTIHMFTRYANRSNPSIPHLGPKLATSNERVFSPEVLQAGKAVGSILTGGFAGGASQSGMSFGGRRDLMRGAEAKPIDTSTLPLATQGYAGGASQSGLVMGGRREIGGSDPGKLNRTGSGSAGGSTTSVGEKVTSWGGERTED